MFSSIKNAIKKAFGKLVTLAKELTAKEEVVEVVEVVETVVVIEEVVAEPKQPSFEEKMAALQAILEEKDRELQELRARVAVRKYETIKDINAKKWVQNNKAVNEYFSQRNNRSNKGSQVKAKAV